MDTNNSFFKRIGKAMTDPRYIKPLLIIICILAVLLSALIVMTGLQVRRERQAELAQAMAAESMEERELLPVMLTAYSTRADLNIAVLDVDGTAIEGQRFSVWVRYPDGESYRFDTEEDGSCYLYGLPGGEYSLEVPASGAYASAGPVICTVVGTDDDPTAEQGLPVLDENGDPRYRYQALLGPHGYLLSKRSHEESRVLPVDSDGDGTPDYGVELAQLPAGVNEDGEAYEAAAYRRTVRLYEDDNRPVADYAIEAVPLTDPAGPLRGWQVLDGVTYYYENGYPATGLRRIDGKLYYFDPQGARAKALGIDASYYNEHIDWKTVKDAGIDFAIVRIGGRGWTSGAPYGDLRTHEYLMEAQEAGVKTGVYFYTSAINTREAMEEAQAALRTLDGIQLELPIFIDMEFSGENPWGRADRLTTAERTEIIRTFCETVRHAGYSAGIYSGQYFYQRTLYYPALSGYTIWMANYTYYGQLPDFPERYDIWQFTERGTVPGVPGRVDLNVVF